MKKILPGLILCIIIAFIGSKIGSLYPIIGVAPFTIILGMIASNTFFSTNIFEKGITFSEKNLLSYSIVFLGGTIKFDAIKSLGFNGVLYIFFQMMSTIIFVISLGKILGFSKTFQSLMASGNAVCGSSAIGAVSPVIYAKKTEKSIAIVIVNLTGTFLMFILVPLSKLLFSFNTIKVSAFIGGILQSMGQVVVAGSLINSDIQETAIIFKIIRIIFLIFIVIIFSKRHTEDKLTIKSGINNIPWYIIGFFILCFLYSIKMIPNNISNIFKITSSKLELIALAGIGMSIKLDILKEQGLKALIYGIAIGVFQIFSAFTLISLLF